jgi:hypothetical protein
MSSPRIAACPEHATAVDATLWHRQAGHPRPQVLARADSDGRTPATVRADVGAPSTSRSIVALPRMLSLSRQMLDNAPGGLDAWMSYLALTMVCYLDPEV